MIFFGTKIYRSLNDVPELSYFSRRDQRRVWSHCRRRHRDLRLTLLTGVCLLSVIACSWLIHTVIDPPLEKLLVQLGLSDPQTAAYLMGNVLLGLIGYLVYLIRLNVSIRVLRRFIVDCLDVLEKSGGRKQDLKNPNHFQQWKTELLGIGCLVGDGDHRMPADHARAQAEKYTDLATAVQGTEGDNVIRALMDSVQVEEDRGVYQAAADALGRFPADRLSGCVGQMLSDIALKDMGKARRLNRWVMENIDGADLMLTEDSPPAPLH